mmetsp:Transcript_26677/g.74921  ORF Transcript_26677/g.74921 Transcript_26677/m.74921 type:complete len:271 (-) Transcript_26677:1455-2267(-)
MMYESFCLATAPSIPRTHSFTCSSRMFSSRFLALLKAESMFTSWKNSWSSEISSTSSVNMASWSGGSICMVEPWLSMPYSSSSTGASPASQAVKSTGASRLHTEATSSSMSDVLTSLKDTTSSPPIAPPRRSSSVCTVWRLSSFRSEGEQAEAPSSCFGPAAPRPRKSFDSPSKTGWPVHSSSGGGRVPLSPSSCSSSSLRLCSTLSIASLMAVSVLRTSIPVRGYWQVPRISACSRRVFVGRPDGVWSAATLPRMNRSSSVARTSSLES